jgi:hypothetical protein
MRSVAAALAVFALALPASATTTVTDFSDLWYNAPAESQSGWGVNVSQQGDVIFATLFVYGQDNTPRWYVAPAVAATGSNTFGGQLFTIGSGTWFGAPWTGITGIRAVGNINFTFGTSTTATMSYTVDNVQVSKSIVRQSWRADVLTGTYVGAVTGRGPQCGGPGIRIPGALVVTHTPPAIVMTLDFAVSPAQTGRCTYDGTYAQAGSAGAITGTYHCDVNGVVNAVTGSFTVDEIRATRSGFNGRLAVVSPQCDYNGYIGGVKDQF